MVGVSKKLYNGVVAYFTETANKLREAGQTEDDERVLHTLDAVLEELNAPAKDDFERMLNLAIVSEGIKEASTALLLLEKYGMADDVAAAMFVYGTIIGVCNVTLLQAGVTPQKVKAHIEEMQDAVVLTEEPVA